MQTAIALTIPTNRKMHVHNNHVCNTVVGDIPGCCVSPQRSHPTIDTPCSQNACNALVCR
jgi:hypothetical protein